MHCTTFFERQDYTLQPSYRNLTFSRRVINFIFGSQDMKSSVPFEYNPCRFYPTVLNILCFLPLLNSSDLKLVMCKRYGGMPPNNNPLTR